MVNKSLTLYRADAQEARAVLPMLSVIVPVRNEQRNLAPTLLQLLEQRYPVDRFEVLVADGRSTDATREIVINLQLQYPNLRLLDNPGKWSSAGRNAALLHSLGDLVVLIDGHCEIDNPEYLLEIVEAFQRSGADCLGRPQPLDVSEASPFQQAIASARSSRLGHHPASYIYANEEAFVPPQSVAIAYRRDVFARVGLFDESFDACEDVEFNHRVAQAGMRCFFTNKVSVRYVPRESLGGLWRQLLRYGRGRGRLLRKHPETFSWTGFAPALFVAGLGLGPLFSLLLPALGMVYLAVITLYAAVVLAFSVSLSIQRRRFSWLFQLPLIFAIVHLSAGVGICWELLVGPARPLEEPNPQPIERISSWRPI